MQQRLSRTFSRDAGTSPRGLEGRIRRALFTAKAGLVWERIWPALVPAICVIALFCIVSWAGLWPAVGPWVRIAIVLAFAVAAIASLYPLLRLRLPTAEEAVARIENTTKLRHRPISTMRDTLSGQVSGEARALWEAHRRRTAETIGRLESGRPSPRMAARDPYALRAIVLLLFVIAAAYAGNNRLARIGQAFLSPEAQIAAATRLDAWVSPPSYTGRPPVLLTGDVAHADSIISVPAGSKLVVRTEDAEDVALAWSPDQGANETIAAKTADSDARLSEIDYDLKTTGTAQILRGRSEVAIWRFEIVADTAPSITLSHDPEGLPSGALRMVYEVSDDYGVISAHAHIAAADAKANSEPLVPAPDFPLTLPQLRARSGNAQTVKDLTSHPWAGAEVIATLEAKDDANQSGLSDPVRFTLPERNFREPLARST